MSTLSKAIEALKNGKMIILTDDEHRENEGDLVLAAEFVTPEAINFMAKFGRGLICLSLEGKRIDELELPLMPQRNQAKKQTAFTISIEAKDGVSTGISAKDRALTIRTAIDPTKGAKDIVSPGHIFPLRAKEGGVMVRQGHTEGSVDLMKLANLRPAAVICEIMNEDGSMARRPDLEVFAKEHGLVITSIKEILNQRIQSEELVELVSKSVLPIRSEDGKEELFDVYAYRSKIDQSEHLALVKGELGSPKTPRLVRMHSECLTGDALFSSRCDCGEQLKKSIQKISEEKQGVILYLRGQEGRGIGLSNKIKAYSLQDQGMNTVDANLHLGFQADQRNFGIGAQILKHLGFEKIKLLTNNPKKTSELKDYGIDVVEQISLETKPTPSNRMYLKTKRDQMGHEMKLMDKVELH